MSQFAAKHSLSIRFLNRSLAPAAALSAAALLAGCASSPARLSPTTTNHDIACVRLIGEQRLPLRLRFKNTTVGGLSGIDYDPRTRDWIVESDDRSEESPARFYVARLDYDAKAFRAVTLTDVHFFRQADGSTYPGFTDYPNRGGEVPDIESIRFDPLDASIWYASEGIRKFGLGPFVKHAKRDGSYLDTLPVGPLLSIARDREWGPRDNLSFEGLSFAPDGQSLWLGMETALYQDGPIANIQTGSVARLSRFTRAGKLIAQYAYPVDPIPHAPRAPGRLADNGVSEILGIDDAHVLMLERSGAQNAAGTFDYFVRLYEADVGKATDIARIDALTNATYTMAAKRLIVDVNQLGLAHVDNLEGMAWGPRLADGHESLVLVSDDNFDAAQANQFLAFEVIPHAERGAACR